MSRNGSGTYNLPAGNPVVTGTTISSSWANTTLNDIATALTGSLAADGQTPVTANFNVNNNRITNLADPSSAQDGATKAYVDASDATNLGLSLLKASNLSDVANATTARGNLTAAKSGANSDITSLTGLTTPLTVTQGGIGAATLTANAVVLGNGTSAVTTVAPSTSGNVLTSNGTTWTSVANPYVGGPRAQVFVANGTFTIPSGVTAVKVTVIGGGGGGAGDTTDGTSGGTSSVSSGTQSITTISGTGGGTRYGGGGSGTNGDLNMTGGAGSGAVSQNAGGGTLYGFAYGSNYGSGGSGDYGGGGGGGTAIKWLSGLTAGNTLTVTRGGGGTGGTTGGNSGAGGVIVFEY